MAFCMGSYRYHRAGLGVSLMVAEKRRLVEPIDGCKELEMHTDRNLCRKITAARRCPANAAEAEAETNG